MTEQELKENYSKEVYEAAITLSPEIQKNVDFPYIKPSYVDESRALSSKIFGQMGDENNKAQEAVLLRAETATRGTSNTVLVLEKNTKGEYVERQYTIKFGAPCIENYPGNHVWIVKSKSGIGIYVNSEKNKKYPRKKSYIAKIVMAKIFNGIDFVISCMGLLLTFCFSFIGIELSLPLIGTFLLGLLIVICFALIMNLNRIIYKKIFGNEMYKYVYSKSGIVCSIIVFPIYFIGIFILLIKTITMRF